MPYLVMVVTLDLKLQGYDGSWGVGVDQVLQDR
jgi:hypothetical protein